ncbi:MAG: DnaJ domain-containing protein [Candidatus Limnocylindrales bacterium]
MQRVPDPYRVLGVSRDATNAEVKAAHRRLAKRYHPDAPHADAVRFLAAQDAYELLRDPLLRREWDRRHAPGPVRAGSTSAAPRRGRTTGGDRPDSSAPPASPRNHRRAPVGVDATFGPNDRPPQADSWTWTAEGVPWWEDGGSPKTRRASRRRPAPGAERPGQAATGGSGTPSGRTSSTEGGNGAEPTQRRSSRTKAPTEPAGAARTEFDVFSRSSGAAWSSASRAYFRRRAADMPSGAANPNTPRWTTPVGAPPPRRYETPTATGPSAGGPTPMAAPRTAGPAPSTPRTRPSSTSPPVPPSATPAVVPPSPTGRRLAAVLAAIFKRGER